MRKAAIVPLLSMLLAACSFSGTPQVVVVTTTPVRQTVVVTTTPTETPTPTNTPTPTPIPNHPVGRIVMHQANEDIVYNWYSYVPRGLNRETTVYILITAVHGGIYDYEESTSVAGGILEGRLGWPNVENFVLLAPVIPRSGAGETPDVYPVAFDLNSFYESDDFYARADLKVLRMVDALIHELTLDGYNVSEKVMIEGFSSGGMFAQRFALLHPDRVHAIAAGHCGGNFTLPLSEYGGVTLNWPVGVSNLEELAGITFDPDSYLTIAQFIYIGALETGEGGTTIVWLRLHPDWEPQSHWESVDQMEFLLTTFGETDPVRLENQVRYLLALGYDNITFTLYPGVGHQQTWQMINDLMTFLDAQRQGTPSAQYGGIVVLPSPTPTPAPALPIVIDGDAQDWPTMTPVLEDEVGDSLAGEDMDLTAMYLWWDTDYVFLMLRTAAAFTEEQAEVDLWLDLLPGSHYDQSEVGLSLQPDNTAWIWDSTICGPTALLPIDGALVLWGDVLEAQIPRASLGEHEHIIPVIVRLNTPFNGEWGSADVMP